MPANKGKRTPDGQHRPPRGDRIALSIRIDPVLHDKVVRSAELNSRSIAAETEFQLRQIYK